MISGINPLIAGGLLALGLLIGYSLRRFLAASRQEQTQKKIRQELEEAKSDAKDIVLRAKDKASSILSDIQKEERERKGEIRKLEERLHNREDDIKKEKEDVINKTKEYEEKSKQLLEKETKVKELSEKIVAELEKVSTLTKEQAKQKLISEIEEEHKEELANKIINLEKEKREELEKKGLEIITSSIQRYSRDNISDITTTSVSLPNDDLKGKIIGKEGRNIRTFEKLTGVEVIVDDAPESITLSSFDPYRRELAKIALEKLIKDGRIQPAKIEEKVEEAREELESHTIKVGEEAAYEAGIIDLPKEIVQLLGRLKYRTSYGQNVLDHSLEMTHISGMIAAELGVNVDITKRGALLHDIGKAIDHEVDGTHVEIGRKLLKKYGIKEEVIRAMESHHDEYPYSSPESYIVAAADAISAARPGARRDTLEKYIKRIEEIEKVAEGFEGVQKVYAISAGREVRVFAVPEKIDDFGALQLAKKIANKIQSDVNYPGEVKVTVVREVKAVEYAK
ncbi:MAG: ribonuclease Y [Candidatus Paceibacterota bacterium]